MYEKISYVSRRLLCRKYLNAFLRRTPVSLWLIIIFLIPVNAQDMRENSFRSLFADQKANKVGDAITIIVVESSQASNNAEKSAGRSSDLGLNLSGTVSKKPIPDADISLGTKNDFEGSGSTKSSGMVKTKISATIDSVLSNGNLFVRGSRKITINGEDQIVSIKGIVRTSDIMADNSVLSYNLSDAEIIFEGKGLIRDAQEPGWLTKFFHWIF
ncbi:MAG TPA: flagellar basal body L-ring protein FlgH [Ignavibacteriaceae bacterium]|jgi:flagellar L-ring protein precursor FlgH|nr:flagellar basal body L-ring protein FlgH [Ignavibacteriaceae bacterium]